jgi:hypothetical protein
MVRRHEPKQNKEDKGHNMRSVNSFILTAAVLVTVIPPAVAGEAANDGAAALSAESVERLKGIGTGSYQITPTREDVPLVLRALQDKDLTISSYACLAVEKMASKKLFKPDDMKAIWEGLRPKLRSQHDDTSEWSARGVGALAQDTELLAGELLNEAFDETILMVSSNGPEMRRRGAGLSCSLVKLLPKDKLEKLVRALLASPVATAEEGKAGNAEARCSWMATAALSSAAPKIETPALANDVAVRLLAAAKDNPAPGWCECRALTGLAYLAGTTSKETREQIVGAVLAAAADGRWIYSVTSGVYSPPKHAGAEALAILASSLTLEELEKAEKAIPSQTAEDKEEEYASMYAAAKEALAARKLVAEHKAQPAADEDVAFFEKKYQKKITGVKPKNEYSDPDQFYSAIGKQLGIPEIAWKAAAEKFGWKKDDGKHTFTLLKGGPTTEGGQGTWDVMFIRYTINPETKKPDPATMEQVMVQLDYDGNIKFPEIPKGIQ